MALAAHHDREFDGWGQSDARGGVYLAFDAVRALCSRQP